MVKVKHTQDEEAVDKHIHDEVQAMIISEIIERETIRSQLDQTDTNEGWV